MTYFVYLEKGKTITELYYAKLLVRFETKLYIEETAI